MKKMFIAILAATVSFGSAADQKPQIVEADRVGEVEKLIVYNGNYYKDGKLQDKYQGKMAALEATIDKIEKGPLDQPIYQVSLANSSKKSIWVASLVQIDETMLSVGAKVRILGLFDKTSEEPEYMAKLTKDPEYLLGFCFYDVNTERPMYRPRLMKTCLDWEYGKKIKDLNP